MYSYIKDNFKNKKTAKGIKKNVIQQDIKHVDYKQTLFNNNQLHHTMKTNYSIKLAATVLTRCTLCSPKLKRPPLDYDEQLVSYLR